MKFEIGQILFNDKGQEVGVIAEVQKDQAGGNFYQLSVSENTVPGSFANRLQSRDLDWAKVPPSDFSVSDEVEITEDNIDEVEWEDFNNRSCISG
jgi:hypothetical protein